MKNIFIAIILALPVFLLAQQDVILTNYSFNSMFFNPAVAGSTGNGQGSAILNYRDQWMGLEGSPKTMLLGSEVNLFDDKVGVGLTLGRESIGVNKQTDAALSIAYRIELEDAYIAAGLRAGFHFFNSDLNQISYTDPSDIVFDQGSVQFNLFSAGAGVYYYKDSFFAGFSVPAISTVGDDRSGFKERHYYMHTGAIFDISEYNDMLLEPVVLLKYQPSAPIQYTLGLKWWFIEDFNAGIHYRSSDAFALSAEFVLMDQLSIGAAYDFSTSPLKDTQDGTVELLLGYKFSYRQDYIPMGRR